MKRVYLSEVIPSTELIHKQTLPPDVRQKLEGYHEEKDSYKNIPPAIRPHPMAKYETSKVETMMTPQDRAEELEEIAGSDDTPRKSKELDSAILSLPKHARPRAKKLAAYLPTVNTGTLDIKDLLYDLTVPNVKKIRSSSREMLSSVIRQLEANSGIDKRLFLNKVAGSTKAHGKPTTSHPTRSYVKSWTPLLGKYYGRHSELD